MNRTLKRPMFRIGGSAGTGITSGLDQPRKQYAQGSGYMDEKIKEIKIAFERYQKMGGTLPFEVFAKEFATENFNSGGRAGYQQGSMPTFQASGVPGFLTSFGLNLLATPPQGNIFQTAGVAAREPFNQLQVSQARQRQLEAEKAFLRSERLEGQKFDESQLEKRLDVEKMKIGSKDSLTVNQLASTYLDDYDGDLNKATNKAKFFLEIRPELSGTVGETQIGGIIEADLSNEKQAKTFARANRNKVGKVFWDINTGTLKKLVKDPETNALGFVDFVTTKDMTPDDEGESLPEEKKIKSPGLYGQETKPGRELKEILPDFRDTGFDEDFYQM